MSNARLHMDSSDSDNHVFAPCRARCPVHIDVPGYLSAVADGRFSDALDIVLERNPLPSVCGRICLRPCEEGCRRCLLDEPVAIAHLKRAAADHGVYPLPIVSHSRPETIGVVGGGPAGLSAAYFLSRLGFGVTIYEAKPLLGGMLRYGIPNYRLPDEALDRDIDHILRHGIGAETGVRVGEDISLSELAERHSAVLVTVGLQNSRSLPIPGVEHERVMTALPFLEASSRGERIDLGERVLVVGGGNVAMDVARTALRQGAKHVRVVCLESAEEMPASAEEIQDAHLEGVEICPSWGPKAVVDEAGTCALETVRCASVFDSEKRFAPRFDDSETGRFEADTLILAIGQSADVNNLGLPLTPRGIIELDPLTLRTAVEKVYAAGDVISGPTKVIDAVAAGQRAAAAICRDLARDPRLLNELDEENAVLGRVPETMASKLETRRRIQMERLEYFESRHTFEEVELGYTEYEAAREAQRCLSCTTGARVAREKCASCLTCMRVCPHGVPTVKVGGWVYFDAEACHACGACASQCPAQAISLEGFSDAELTRTVQRTLADAGLDTTVVFACGSTPILPAFPGRDVRTITLTCLLRVSTAHVLQSLHEGASRVVFAGCVEASCRFPHARVLVGNLSAKISRSLEPLGMSDSFVVATGADDEELAHL